MQMNLGAGVAVGWLLATVCTQATAHAQDRAPARAQVEQRGRATVRRREATDVWEVPVQVDNPKANGLQYLGLNGRYHGQVYGLDSSEGNTRDWENRQSRVGFDATFANKWELYTSLNLNLDEGALVDNIDEAYVTWKPSENFSAKAGKMKIGLTPEYRTSSKYTITPELSQVVNQVTLLPLWGGQVAGKAGKWLYEAQVSTTGLDPDFRWPSGDGGVVTFLSVGYEWEEAGTTRMEWLWNGEQGGSKRGGAYENVVSLSHEAHWGKKVDLVVNGIYAHGQEGGGNLWGAVVMPSVMLTDKLQGVARLTIAHSDTSDGVRLQTRYEQEAPELVSAYARDYRSAYAGVNYYVHNHRLKFMAGVEYSAANRDDADYEAVTGIAAVRVFFGKGKTTVP